MFRRGVLSLLALVTVAGEASAQPAVGPEFQVNTYTTISQNRPAIAADANGNFVVVWQSYDQDGDIGGVFGQRYDRLGNPRGGEFAVNTYTTSYQEEARVAVHPTGDFVVTWSSPGSQDGVDIFARRYDADGNPAGPEFTLNSFFTGDQISADVAPTADGGFVVVWVSYQPGEPDGGVFGRIFDASGNPVGGDFQVNTYTTAYQVRPAVATAPSGDFVVVWTSYWDQDGSESGVFGQWFNAKGAARGGEFRVNIFTPDWQAHADVTADAAGNFVVVWDSYDQDGSSYGVFGRRFDATGAPAGGEFSVNAHTTDSQARPSISGEPDGHFVVTWTSTDQSYAYGAEWAIFAQRFDPSGAKVGPEFQVNTYTTNYRGQPAVASLGKEKFVVAWTSYGGQDGDGPGIFAQRFGDLVFRDGFE